MTEEKRNRIVAAATVSTILLIVILAAIVIYQLVVISSIKKKKENMESDISYYRELTEKQEQNLDDLQSLWYLQEKLIEYGYHY